MDTKNFKSLESLQTASDVENMLRLLARLPKLKVFVLYADDLAYPVGPEDESDLAAVIAEKGSLTVEFDLVE